MWSELTDWHSKRIKRSIVNFDIIDQSEDKKLNRLNWFCSGT
jgi:hypothetical protein